MGSMSVQYVQGIQPNVPARTSFIEICHYKLKDTKYEKRNKTRCTWTPFHHPLNKVTTQKQDITGIQMLSFMGHQMQTRANWGCSSF